MHQDIEQSKAQTINTFTNIYYIYYTTLKQARPLLATINTQNPVKRYNTLSYQYLPCKLIL